MGEVTRLVDYVRGGNQRDSYNEADVEEVPCPLCGAVERATLYVERAILGIVRCRRCTLIYVSPRLRNPEQVYWGDADKYEEEARLFVSEHGRRYFETLMGTSYQSVGCSRLGTPPVFPAPLARVRPFTLVSCSGLIPLKRVELVAEALSHVTSDVRWIHIGESRSRDGGGDLCRTPGPRERGAARWPSQSGGAGPLCYPAPLSVSQLEPVGRAPAVYDRGHVRRNHGDEYRCERSPRDRLPRVQRGAVAA